LGAHNIALTAAHCIYNRSSASFYSLAATRFRPGREGDCNDISCQPYGAPNATWYFTPAEYRNDANPWQYLISVEPQRVKFLARRRNRSG